MKLLSTNAESLLLAKAKSISEQHTSWRCIYINFSDHKEYAEGVRTNIVTNILKDLLDREEGYVYLCEDGDVVILFQGKTMNIVSALGQHFQELDELYSVLDLGKHWQVFFNLCKAKVERVAQSNAPAPQPTAPEVPLRQPDRELFHANAAKRARRTRPVVLLVEDDPFTRRLVSATLKGDFDILEAGSGAEALTAYESGAPDAVFLDIELPDSNGHAVLGRLLLLDQAAFVVMLSANSVKENILAALEKGAQGFVAKPFARDKLMHYLNLCTATQRSKAHEGSVA